MRKLIVTTMITIDGVMQAPGDSKEDTAEGFKFGGWPGPYNDSFTEKQFAKDMSGKFDLLLGRKTYKIFAGYWPQHADAWPHVNEVTKYVVSRKSSLKLDWQNSILLDGDVVKEVKQLKKEKGRDLEVWGSSNLIQTLLKHDLGRPIVAEGLPHNAWLGQAFVCQGCDSGSLQINSLQSFTKGRYLCPI